MTEPLGCVKEVDLVPYTAREADNVAAIFNRHMASQPYVAKISPDLILHRIARKSFFDSQGLVIGYRGRHPVGLVHVTFGPPNKGETELNYTKGNIQALVFPPDDIEIGTALLEYAVRYAKSKGAEEIQGWSSHAGYPFYKGIYMGTEPVLSANLPHVVVRLVQAGFRLFQHSIFLARRLESRPVLFHAAPPVELVHQPLPYDNQWQQDCWLGLEPQVIFAERGGTRVGHLIWTVLPELTSKRGWPVGSIAALGVHAECHRQGIAKALVSESLRLMYLGGAREATVATTQDNSAALHTYYSMGFVEEELLLGYVWRNE